MYLVIMLIVIFTRSKQHADEEKAQTEHKYINNTLLLFCKIKLWRFYSNFIHGAHCEALHQNVYDSIL